MYLLQVHFHGEESILSSYVVEHTKWVKNAILDKLFILAGQKIEGKGGVILVVDMPESQLNELISQDPFVKKGLASYTSCRFEPALYQDVLLNFISG
ncbi:YciI family protein [Legionella spiritensis]|uniref:YCII domain-containing protein n=1 Tax=Legionella spiritensis TaxID=452 RepID=A0A0W0YYY6_LEGSP|nr:hypothetical protein [Legionella spiritensis]KTD62112.1 hypothetical protein Lspi_1962 [Legionella spiritensis]SNV34183.1 Uncharacterised protein [Legionella spiritensis]